MESAVIIYVEFFKFPINLFSPKFTTRCSFVGIKLMLFEFLKVTLKSNQGKPYFCRIFRTVCHDFRNRIWTSNRGNKNRLSYQTAKLLN